MNGIVSRAVRHALADAIGPVLSRWRKRQTQNLGRVHRVDGLPREIRDPSVEKTSNTGAPVDPPAVNAPQ